MELIKSNPNVRSNAGQFGEFSPHIVALVPIVYENINAQDDYFYDVCEQVFGEWVTVKDKLLATTSKSLSSTLTNFEQLKKYLPKQYSWMLA